MTILKTFIAVAAAGAVVFLPVADACAAETAPRVRPANIAQQSFAQPQDAAQALHDAMKSGDWTQIYSVLGRGSGKLIYTGDKVADAATRDEFVAAYEKSSKIEPSGDARATLLIGDNNYPFPFPLVKGAQGWSFDARAGAEEIVNRRVGQNELAAIQVCLAYLDAQREYVLKDRDNNGLLEYAQKLVSSPGKRDGLYWPTKDGEPPSPFGPLASRAAGEGYGPDATSEPQAYHGYHYRVLTAQGSSAQGGAYSYLVKGKMIGGFALIAYPARWGVSGVMSFTCSHDGVVYEKNLGRDTRKLAQAMTTFDPDPGWQKVPLTQ
jgi:hypothetical protein